MKFSRTFALAVAFVALSACTHAGWFSDETPPANAKPLSEIIKVLEDQGHKTITEIEFEDGVWEIEIHQSDGKEIKLKVDPVSGDLKG
ncbi:MAG: PepSY domain-containing protein [Hyphomonas sp.]|jgi:hypothetical protein|tara:strand:+ start:4616 stop:4879 length:264 start_codon:yes stop_codon:yes gene_type:complete